MQDVCLPCGVLQYLLYLSSRISPARVPLCSVLCAQKSLGRVWKTQESFASDLLCNMCLQIKDSPSLLGGNHPL